MSMGITRHGIEHFYLKGKEDHDFVPRKALVEAVGLIDEAYEEIRKTGNFTYETLVRIQPRKDLEECRIMIATKDGNALHKTGIHPIIEGEPIIVGGMSNDFYIGNALYSCFISVYFPKEYLREMTEEESKKYNRGDNK